MDSTSTSSARRRPWDGRKRLIFGCGIISLLALCVVGVVLVARFVASRDLVAQPSGTVTTTTPVATEGADTDLATPTAEGATGEAAPAVETGLGRIVFVNGGGQLGTVDGNGEDLRFIGDQDERVFLFPAWSPDASTIAAIGAGQTGGGVYVLPDTVESEPTELYFSRNGAPIYLYWQPDGSAVSFIASGEESLNLFLSAASGEGSVQLLAEGQPLYWDWVGEQTRLLVHTGTPLSGGQLRLVDVEDGTNVDAGANEVGFFQAPGVSSGGLNLAFAELDGRNRWLTVRNFSSGEVQRTAHEGVLAMGWSPVEQKVAFISPEQSDPSSLANYFGPLRIFDAESGDVAVLTDDIVLAFFWAPDGQNIAYFTLTEGVGEQIAADEADGKIMSPAKTRTQHEDVLLSLFVVSISGGQPHHLVDFRPTELFVTQFLPFFDQYALSHRLWSPDSGAIVLPILDEDRARIYVVPISGTGLRDVADGLLAFWAPQ